VPYPPHPHQGGVVVLPPVIGIRRSGAVPNPAIERDWPRTTRVLPWLLALFLVGVFLIPLDAITLPVSLPFNAKLDRVLVGLMVLVWAVGKLLGRATAAESRRATPIHLALFLFVVAAIASIVVNVDTLTKLNEYNPAIKQLAVLVAFAAFFGVVASTVRPGEIKPFITLVVVLASITAIGTIYEYQSDTNVFFDWTDAALPAGIDLSVAEGGVDASGREGTTGPTQNGLGIATLLSLVIPFAVVGFFQARTVVHKLLYSGAIWLLFAAAIATERKSALLVPVAIALVLIVYRPQQMLRLAPVLVIMVAAVPILSSGAMDTVQRHLFAKGFGKDVSTKGRTTDYDAVRPDVRSHLALGRGFGSYDFHRYRVLDNAYLGLLIETGFVGLAAFLLTLLAVLAMAHSLIRSRNPTRGPPALALAAATAGFAVATFFYDAFTYVQVPYLFFFFAGLVAIYGAQRLEENAPPRGRLEAVPA
jgi:hypothetical protein